MDVYSQSEAWIVFDDASLPYILMINQLERCD